VRAAPSDAPLPNASGFRSLTGDGVQETIDGSSVEVGGAALLRERGLDDPPEIREELEKWRQRGASVLLVLRDRKAVGALALEDQVRQESVEASRQLHDLGVRAVMLTGDARQVAEAVAEEIGVDEVLAEVLPGTRTQR
jgi:P-type Cu2+ transporter